MCDLSSDTIGSECLRVYKSYRNNVKTFTTLISPRSYRQYVEYTKAWAAQYELWNSVIINHHMRKQSTPTHRTQITWTQHTVNTNNDPKNLNALTHTHTHTHIPPYWTISHFYIKFPIKRITNKYRKSRKNREGSANIREMQNK